MSIDWTKVETAEMKQSQAQAAAVAAQKAEAKQYLANTDWYVIRQLELSTPIPDDVAAGRANARLALQ